MKSIVKIICIAVCTTSFFNTIAQKNITLEDIWLKGTFAAKSVPGFNVMNDGVTYVQQDADNNIALYNIRNNKKVATVFDRNKSLVNNEKLTISSFEFSNDEKKLLLFTNPENIYRRSVLNNVYVYDILSKKITALDTAKVLHASFSPDGTKVAFVKDNNVFYKDLISGTIIPITHDGEKNKIINGNCDWVYEEEFEFTKAYQWSPQGNYLAYYHFDESNVKEFTIPFYDGNDYPRMYTFKYPKAGESNSKVCIYIYDVKNKKTALADVGNVIDQYIPRIKWTNNDEELCIYRLNRHQNNLELLLANAKSGSSKVIYSEQNKYYVDINDNLTFLKDNTSFIINSERNGYNHLYKWNWKTQNLTPLTSGSVDVTQMVGIDLKTETVFYITAENPLQRAFYSVNTDGKNTKKLSKQNGTHDIQACNGLKYFVDIFSTANTPPVYTLIDHTGKTVRALEQNEDLKKKLEEYHFAKIEFTTIPNNAGEMLNAYMIKPANFSSSKKYPVLMYQYSGPGSQQVLDRYPMDNFYWHQMLAQQGYLIVVADGTGTGGRGEDFKKKTYLQLGKYESDDQIAVAKFLAKQSYVDEKRIGIWGWSFGGFMSSTCILKAPDVFKTAIAVAPVTNWRYYDNIYTERYMRTPEENQKGYDDNAPEKMAKNLKGNFLLIHGTADDNVHFQNAAELTKNLIEENKQFESVYYPNKNHSIRGGTTRFQLYKKMTDYLLKNL